MGHHIKAILINGPVDAAAQERFDLRPVALSSRLTMFHIDHSFTAYWQSVCGSTEWLDLPQGFPAIFPSESIVKTMACELTGQETPTFAVIMTDYFGGAGDQWAAVFEGERRTSADNASINTALAALGVVRRDGMDEFDTVGLGRHRSSPDHLERYADLCDERGV